MTVQSWDTSLSGVDPFTHARFVLVVPAQGAATGRPTADHAALEELRRHGWTVTVTPRDADAAVVADLARAHDVALFCDVRGTHALRRTLTALLPTVAVVPPRRRGRAVTLLREAGARRDTTVLIVRDPRDAKVLRRLCGSALVRSDLVGGHGTTVRDRAAALGAVLLRAHAWQPAPAPAPRSRPVAAVG